MNLCRHAASRSPRRWRSEAARGSWRQCGLGALLRALGLAAAFGVAANASAYSVVFDTSSLSGQAGRFEFLLLDGDAVADNAVTVGNLASNGAPAGTECVLGCTPAGASFVVDDGLALGQLLVDLTLGTVFSFDLSFTTNFAGVPGVDPPDRLAVSLLDPATNFTRVTTDLLFPADALLTIDLIGNGVIQRARVTSPTIGFTVPEPGMSWLIALPLVWVVAGRRAVCRGLPPSTSTVCWRPA